MALRYLKNVTTLQLDPTRCTGCGICVEVCPHGVFRIESRKASIVDRDACMECGACARNCPFGALFVRSGVGCASALIHGILQRQEVSCGCSNSTCCGSESDSR